MRCHWRLLLLFRPRGNSDPGGNWCLLGSDPSGNSTSSSCLGQKAFTWANWRWNFFTRTICTAEVWVLSSPLLVSAKMIKWLEMSWFQTFSRLCFFLGFLLSICFRSAVKWLSHEIISLVLSVLWILLLLWPSYRNNHIKLIGVFQNL